MVHFPASHVKRPEGTWVYQPYPEIIQYIIQYIKHVIFGIPADKSHKIPLNHHVSYGFPIFMVFLWVSYGFPTFTMVFP